MPTIYPTIYTYPLTTSVTTDSGYWTSISQLANTSAITIYGNGAQSEKVGMSHSADNIVEALFKLNPSIRKRYKGDKKLFADELIDAAAFKDGDAALKKLTGLKLAE